MFKTYDKALAVVIAKPHYLYTRRKLLASFVNHYYQIVFSITYGDETTVTTFFCYKFNVLVGSIK